MAQFIQWGVAVSLLSLIALQSQAVEEAFATPQKVPTAEELFNEVSGGTLSKDEFFNFIEENMNSYFMNIQDDLKGELFDNFDKDSDGQMSKKEYEAFLEYVNPVISKRV